MYQAVNLHMFIRLQDHLEIIVFKIVQPKQFINMLKELYAYKIVKDNMQTQNLVIFVINNVNIEQMITELNSVWVLVLLQHHIMLIQVDNNVFQVVQKFLLIYIWINFNLNVVIVVNHLVHILKILEILVVV